MFGSWDISWYLSLSHVISVFGRHDGLSLRPVFSTRPAYETLFNCVKTSFSIGPPSPVNTLFNHNFLLFPLLTFLSMEMREETREWGWRRRRQGFVLGWRRRQIGRRIRDAKFEYEVAGFLRPFLPPAFIVLGPHHKKHLPTLGEGGELGGRNTGCRLQSRRNWIGWRKGEEIELSGGEEIEFGCNGHWFPMYIFKLIWCFDGFLITNW